MDKWPTQVAELKMFCQLRWLVGGDVDQGPGMEIALAVPFWWLDEGVAEVEVHQARNARVAVQIKQYRGGSRLKYLGRIESLPVGRLGHFHLGGTGPIAKMCNEVVLTLSQPAGDFFAHQAG